MPPAKAASSRRRAPKSTRRLALPLLALAAAAFGAIGFAAYVFWPRWPAAPVAQDAPSLPVTVGGVAFNIPPGAIRQAVQRNPGTHARLDLTFLWPSLTPPDPTAPSTVSAETPLDQIKAPDRAFVTIAAVSGTLSPEERRRTIYPRYLAAGPLPGPEGLTVASFRDDTPYRGEDLVVASKPGTDFAARCTRPAAGGVPGTCLHERRIGEADIVVRFPRDWLDEWQTTAATIDRLIAQIRAHPP